MNLVQLAHSYLRACAAISNNSNESDATWRHFEAVKEEFWYACADAGVQGMRDDGEWIIDYAERITGTTLAGIVARRRELCA